MYSGLDKDGHVYLELQKGNKEQAEMYLLEIEKENGALNEFQTCYMGLARNDKSLIEKSYMMFLQKKSLFYANLPKLYLGDFKNGIIIFIERGGFIEKIPILLSF